jgi:hypothetical protein
VIRRDAFPRGRQPRQVQPQPTFVCVCSPPFHIAAFSSQGLHTQLPVVPAIVRAAAGVYGIGWLCLCASFAPLLHASAKRDKVHASLVVVALSIGASTVLREPAALV